MVRNLKYWKNMKSLSWCRSQGGYCYSKCGRFHIYPEYWGSTTPQSYTLKDETTKEKHRLIHTQRDAKAKASEIVRIEK